MQSNPKGFDKIKSYTVRLNLNVPAAIEMIQNRPVGYKRKITHRVYVTIVPQHFNKKGLYNDDDKFNRFYNFKINKIKTKQLDGNY